MLTERGWWLLAAAGLFWLASRAFGVAELSMAALGLLLLLLFAVIYTRVTSARLTAIRRVHPGRLFFDATGAATLTIRNAGRLPTALMEIEDAGPAAISDGARFVLAPLRPAGEISVTYALLGRQRGRFTIGPLTVNLRDPFGVAARTETFGEVNELVVYPPVWALPASLPLGGRQTGSGEGSPRPLATGEELANVRDYVHGDDLRKVHWRSTAHRGKLMVRQSEAPQQPSATVVLDTRAASHAGVGAASSFEYAVAAAASITYHLSARAYTTRLLTEALQTSVRSQPWQVTLEQLATIEPAASANLDGLWQQLRQGLGGDGILVFIGATPTPADLRAMVRAGRGFGQRLAVLLEVDTFGRRRRGSGQTPAAAEVQTAVHGLRAAGWRVTTVRSDDLLADRWRELLLFQRGVPTATPAGTQ